MTSNIDLNGMTKGVRDERILALATEMSDALSKKMMRVPGMTPEDQIAVHMIATARACAVACTTILGGYEGNARACGEVLFSRIMSLRANAEGAVTRAYTLKVPE